MLQCGCYKMFRGKMRITPKNPKFTPWEEEGVWLYKPEYSRWYGNGYSYAASCCAIVEDFTN